MTQPDLDFTTLTMKFECRLPLAPTEEKDFLRHINVRLNRPDSRRVGEADLKLLDLDAFQRNGMSGTVFDIGFWAETDVRRVIIDLFDEDGALRPEFSEGLGAPNVLIIEWIEIYETYRRQAVGSLFVKAIYEAFRGKANLIAVRPVGDTWRFFESLGFRWAESVEASHTMWLNPDRLDPGRSSTEGDGDVAG